jgi:amidohydrolase
MSNFIQENPMLKQAHALTEEIIDWRRDFHMYPEIGFEVQRTAGIVADELEKLGYRVKREIGVSGVVAELGEGRPIVAIRADMDALPLEEMNDFEYKSTIPGAMHACGHDSHTAMALGAASVLARESFPGTVRFLFQPSEEVADEEGKSGAMRMVEDGAMQSVDYVLAQHVDPTIPVGSIGISPGPAYGGVDSWFGEIIGKGGHGALPHNAIDTFSLTAHVILALSAITSRRIDPFAPSVVSIGSVNGGFTENVIPERVRITGTLRFTTPEVQEKLHAEISRAFEITRTLGGDYDLEFETGSPPMINDAQITEVIKGVGLELLGEEHVCALHKTLGAEDFGSFLEHAPGAMFTLGVQKRGHEGYYLHHPKFELDERALPYGTAVLAATVMRLLRGEI